MKMQLTEFGVYIRKYRGDHSIKQKDMAKAIGISNYHLSNIEAGKRSLKEYQVVRLARVYNLDLFYLKHFMGNNNSVSQEFQVVHTGNIAINNQLVKLLRQKIDVMSNEDKQKIINILNKNE